MKLDLRLKDEMVKEQWRNPRPQIEMDIETWQITFDANKTARNKDFLEACECLKKQKQ